MHRFLFCLCNLKNARIQISQAAPLIAALCFGSVAATAQDTPDVAQGFAPYASFHGSDVDNVNLLNGNLVLKIPLYSLPQRGRLGLSFSVVYNSPTYHIVTDNCIAPPNFGHCDHTVTDQQGAPGGYAGTPFSPTVVLDQKLQLASVSTIEPGQGQDQFGNDNESSGHYYVVDSAGGQHPLGHIVNSVYRSIDGAGYLLTLQSGDFYPQGLGKTLDTLNFSGKINDSNGISYTGSSIQDPDGNFITLSTAGITDSAGRSIPPIPIGPTTTNPSSCPDLKGSFQSLTGSATWSVPGLNGTTMQYVFCYTRIQVRTYLLHGAPNTITSTNREFNAPAELMLQSIVLPNGQYWGFVYDAADPSTPADHRYGMLTKLLLPSGGTILYTAGLRPGFCEQGSPPPDEPFTDTVSGRTVTPGDGSTNTWTYATIDNGGGLPAQTIVKQPTGDETVHSFGAGTDCDGLLETAEQQYQGSHLSGQLLKTITNQYVAAPANYGYHSVFSLLGQRSITLPKGGASITSSTSDQYDPGLTFSEQIGIVGQTGSHAFFTSQVPLGDVVSQTDNDYGGAVLRQVTGNFKWQETASPFLAANLLNAKSSEKILTSTGAIAAKTDYTYDESTRIVSSGIGTQHILPPSGNALGHVTTTTKYLNTGTSPTLATYWYDTGMVQKKLDGNSKSTTYGYDALGAVVTGVTDALNHTTTYGYDAGLVKVTSVTGPNRDPNPETISYSYDGSLRLLTATYPDGGGTTNLYSTGLPFSVTRTTKIGGTVNLQTFDLYDGLLRPSQHQLTSDPDGADTTTTTYDSLGQVAAVSNPKRTATATTDGTTQSVYDALGRVTTTIPPDGSGTSDNVTTTYTGNCATVVDEASKQRKSCSDALGRLTQVLEPDASNALANETDYQYDALGNLLRVDQKGNTSDSMQWRTRLFTYDSLSRLLQSFNPESGLTNYTYDANGNLVSKAQPRAINILPTITYCYDALNRLASKSFSAQSCPMSSPDVIYNYDQGSFNGHTIANGIGRRTSMTDGTGLSVWSYDTMGRTVNEWRTTNGITKSFAWLWKQDGSLGQVTYPDGSIVTITAGAAGRPLGVTDSAHNIKYALNLKYAPTGQIATAGYGLNGGFAFAETNTYNNRLQPSELKVTGTASVLDLVYGFGFGVNDNGNVLTIQNEKDETSNRDQTFTYDPMNRLATAQTPTAWGIGFSYDAWGNLYQTSPVAGTAMNPQTFSTTPTINNQLLGYGYDGAGNLINDGSSHSCAGATAYQYDAENRMTCAAGYNFTYDGDGMRVSKSSGTMYWGGGLAESDAAGNLTAEYIMLNGKRIARRDLPSGLVHYYFSDHLGSSNIVASQAGVIENESDYYPFGGEHVVIQNLPNQHFKFTGKERDAESNLDYFGARYYSSTVGRFTSPDWADKPEAVPYSNLGNPQSLNLYTYLFNDPVTSVDADGHEQLQPPPEEVPVADPDTSEGRPTEDQKIDESLRQIQLSQEPVQSPEATQNERNLIEKALGPDPIEKMAVKAIAEDAAKRGVTKNADAVTSGGQKNEEVTGKTGGLQKQLASHEQKLADYKANPDAHDNKDILKGASPERRQAIIDGRVKNLQKQIDTLKKDINNKQ